VGGVEEGKLWMFGLTLTGGSEMVHVVVVLVASAAMDSRDRAVRWRRVG
jgi:hypothetical protein